MPRSILIGLQASDHPKYLGHSYFLPKPPPNHYAGILGLCRALSQLSAHINVPLQQLRSLNPHVTASIEMQSTNAWSSKEVAAVHLPRCHGPWPSPRTQSITAGGEHQNSLLLPQLRLQGRGVKGCAALSAGVSAFAFQVGAESRVWELGR